MSSGATQPASSSGAAGAGDWVCVGHAATFGPRTAMKVHGRYVTVLRLRKRGAPDTERWTCVDTTCYHAGGPLTDGPLRNVAGRTCLQCPWHSYLVDVFSGEGLYMDLDRTYQSKGLRQRVHKVERRDDDHVYVKLVLDDSVPSDSYAYGPKFGAGAQEKDEELPSFPDW